MRDIPVRLRRPPLEAAAREPRREEAQRGERLDGKVSRDRGGLRDLAHPLNHMVVLVVGFADLDAVDRPHVDRRDGAVRRISLC